MQTPDYIVFFIYFIIVSAYGLYVYNRKKHEDSKDYFLAKDSLTWWAIGASLIASNISAEQFIGMSGSGFTMGLAIAAYDDDGLDIDSPSKASLRYLKFKQNENRS